MLMVRCVTSLCCQFSCIYCFTCVAVIPLLSCQRLRLHSVQKAIDTGTHNNTGLHCTAASGTWHSNVHTATQASTAALVTQRHQRMQHGSRSAAATPGSTAACAAAQPEARLLHWHGPAAARASSRSP